MLNLLPRISRIVCNARALMLSGVMLAVSPALAAGSTAASEGAPVSASAASAVPAPTTRTFALSFGNIKVVSRSIVSYRCENGREIGVAYMNTDNQQSFAVIRIEGRHLVFVDTAAGSGVRYVAGRYVWWSKGDEGNLYDVMAGENAAPIAKACKAIEQ